MANTVTKTSIVDGDSVGVIHVYLASDGAAGELTDTVVLDASALAGAKSIKQIISVKSSLIGFTGLLEFDQTTDSPAVVIPSGVEEQDFSANPINNPGGTGTTGDVVLTTTGFTASGDMGTLIIKYRK